MIPVAPPAYNQTDQAILRQELERLLDELAARLDALEAAP